MAETLTMTTGAHVPRFRRILIVDDDERTRRAFARCRVDGVDVSTAGTGHQALELLATYDADLVILDLRLGTESGRDVMRAMKARRPDLAIVIISGYLSVAVAVALLHDGATTVVFKPVTLVEILEELDRLQRYGDHPVRISSDGTPTLARAEWEHMMRVFQGCGENVSAAARRLGVRRTTLQRKLKKDPPSR